MAKRQTPSGSRNPASRPVTARAGSARPGGRRKPAPAAEPARAKKLERVKFPAAVTPPAKRIEPSSSEGKYVYCIIKSERPLYFGPLGLGQEPAEVHTVIYRDLAAVV